MCIGSCSKLKISTFLGICSYGMYIFYFIFVQFMQFPVFHFGLAHSSSRPLKSYWFYEIETRAVRKLSNPQFIFLHWAQGLHAKPNNFLAMVVIHCRQYDWWAYTNCTHWTVEQWAHLQPTVRSTCSVAFPTASNLTPRLLLPME